MAEYIVEKKQTSGGWTWAEPKGKLIRCKDCKFSSPNGVYGCRIKSFADDIDKRLYSDDFCSRAERKEE